MPSSMIDPGANCLPPECTCALRVKFSKSVRPAGREGLGTEIRSSGRVVGHSETVVPRKWALGKMTASWDGLSHALREFYCQVFPDDWQPDLEPSRSRVIWPICLPEGSRLVRLAGVVRRLPVAQRWQVRAALVNVGIGGGDLHVFDTYTEMFLQESPSQILDPNRVKQADDVVEEFVEDVVKDEMRQGNIAANRPDPGRYAEATAASWLLEAVAFGQRDPCFLAANYAKVLARHLAEDDLSL